VPVVYFVQCTISGLPPCGWPPIAGRVQRSMHAGREFPQTRAALPPVPLTGETMMSQRPRAAAKHAEAAPAPVSEPAETMPKVSLP